MLGDFGISRQLEHASQLASTWVGTPLYMSPEVLEGREYGRPNDVWSVGCVMVEIMAQRCAFHAASLEDLRRRVAALSHEPVPACYSQAAKDLVALMLQRVSGDETRKGHVEQCKTVVRVALVRAVQGCCGCMRAANRVSVSAWGSGSAQAFMS